MGVAKDKRQRAQVKQLKLENADLREQLKATNQLLYTIRKAYEDKKPERVTEGGIILPR